MANLTNKLISETYPSLLKTSNNEPLSSSLVLITDGDGNDAGIKIDNTGNLDASNKITFGQGIVDKASNVDVSKFVTQADGIDNNNNDTSIPTSAAVKELVRTSVTAQDLDFRGDSGSGDVDLDSETFDITGSNGLSTTALNNTLVIDGSTLETAINTNTSDISTNTSNISTNTTNISTNATNIQNNADEIAQQQIDIDSKVSKSGDRMTGDLTMSDANISFQGTQTGNILLNSFDTQNNNVGRIAFQGDSEQFIGFKSNSEAGQPGTSIYQNRVLTNGNFQRNSAFSTQNDKIFIGGIDSIQNLGSYGQIKIENLSKSFVSGTLNDSAIISLGAFTQVTNNQGTGNLMSRPSDQNFNYSSFAVGDQNQIIAGDSAVIGASNELNAQNSLVVGSSNLANPDTANTNKTFASIISGSQNQSKYARTGIVTGFNNFIGGRNNIVGGQNNLNTITESLSPNNNIVSGTDNEIYADSSSNILSGTRNQLYDVSPSNIVSGVDNTVHRGQSNLVIGNTNTLGVAASTTTRVNNLLAGLNNNVVGNASAAIGNQNFISSNNSLALGQENVISSLRSLALGYQNTTNGNNSVVVGYSNEMTSGGNNNIIIGARNANTGTGQNTENYIFGENQIINGTNCVNNILNGRDSSISSSKNQALYGYGLTASQINTERVTTGTHCANNTNSDVAFVVGGGTSVGSQQNAIEVYKGTGTTDNQVVIPRIQEFANNADAVTAGLQLYALYHTAGDLKVRI